MLVVSDQYIIESVKKGKFLTGDEIDENDNIDCTYQTIIRYYGSIHQFRFKCMCEVMGWTDEDLNDIFEHYDENVESMLEKRRKYRIA